MFPTPFTVKRIPRTRSGENALGQPIYTESPPVPVRVSSIQPTSQEERYAAAIAGRTVSDLKLILPTGVFRSTDAVVVDGVTYEVDGEPLNHNTGWHGFKPGYTVQLRKVADV